MADDANVKHPPEVKTDISGLRFPRLRWAVFCLVFIGIPLYLIRIGFYNVWNSREQQELRQFEEKLERITAGFDRFRQTNLFIEELFRDLVKKVFYNSSSPERTFSRYRAYLHKRFPGLFEFTYIDKNGNARPELCDRPPYKALMKNLAACIKAKTVSGNDEILKKNWPRFQNFLGPLLTFYNFRMFKLFTASVKDKRRFVIVSGWTSSGMLVVHVNHPPNWEAIAAIDRVSYINKRFSTIKAFVVDESSGRAEVFGPTCDLSELTRIYAYFTASPKIVMTSGSTSWGYSLLSPSVKVLVRASRKPLPGLAEKRIIFNWLLVGVFIAFAWPTWMVVSGKWLLYISIRQKLVGLFLYMVALPLAFMSMVAGDYLIEKQVVLEKQLHDEMEKALLFFDKRMPLLIGEIDRAMRRILSPSLPDGMNMRALMLERMNRFKAVTGLDAGILINEDCEIEYALGDVSFATTRNTKMLKPIYKSLFEQCNRIESQTDILDSQPFKIAAIAGIEAESVYAELAASLGRMFQYNVSGRKGIQIILPIPDETGWVRYLLVAGWPHTTISKLYLAKYLMRNARQLNDTRWLAYDNEYKRVVVPSNFPKKLINIDAFAARINTQGQTMRGNTEIHGSRYLLTGIPGQHMDFIDLIAVTSDRFIRTELARLSWLIGIVSLATLLTGGVVGTLLARKFLEPIGYLSEGVAALRIRKFDKRLPILDNDELGDLSQTFNEMMEGMADLEVARIVQESLFPTTALTMPPFDIYGSCVAASQAGGDYYDFFPSADGKVMLLVGDVSGHGVGAAMVMGMAKALVAHIVNHSIDPAVVLGGLNATLLKVLNRRRMMSCFVAFLDCEGKKMLFANAGHNDPFVVRGGTTIIPVEGQRSFPLGSSKRNSFVSSEFAFESGDKFILYTDGVVEAEAYDGKPVGYTRFLEALPTLMRGSSIETERALRDWHRRIVKPGPQADDITIVVVQVA